MAQKREFARYVQRVPDGFGYKNPHNLLKLGQAYPIEAKLNLGSLEVIKVKGIKEGYFPSAAFEIVEL